jgi:cytochrome P450
VVLWCTTEVMRLAEATTDPVRLPPGPRIPKIVMGLAFLTVRHRAVVAVGRRFGSTFTVDLPIFGEAVVVSDRTLVKELFTAKGELVARASNLGTVLGPGSTFSLDGDEHRERRKLLVPPFHGKRMAGYEAIVEEEVMREIASWPQGREFETLEPMMRITLNAILARYSGRKAPRSTNCANCFRRWCHSPPGWR